MDFFTLIGVLVAAAIAWNLIDKKIRDKLATVLLSCFLVLTLPAALPMWLATDKFGWDKEGGKTILFTLGVGGAIWIGIIRLIDYLLAG